MRKVVLTALLAGLTLAVLAGAQSLSAGHGKSRLDADTLNGWQEVAGTAGLASHGSGEFKADVDDEKQTVDWNLTYTGLASPATDPASRHRHRSASGHAPQAGARAEQTRAPSSITAAENLAALAGGCGSSESISERSAAVERAYAKRDGVTVDHLDGLTVTLPDGSWFNLRPSNTEPLLRLNVEAADRAAMAGLRLPVQSHPLQALVSELLEQVLPCVVMSNAVHVYVSQAHKGELVMGAGIDAYNGYGQRGAVHVIEAQMAAALELFPLFAQAHVLRTWGGIVDTTFDASPIVSKTPIDQLYVNCGWGTGGFKGTPAAGLAFAHTIAHDDPHPLARPFSLERFETGHLIDEHGAAAVAH